MAGDPSPSSRSAATVTHAVVVVAKYPGHRCKTRLIPALGQALARDTALALLSDTLLLVERVMAQDDATAAASRIRKVWLYAPPSALPEIQEVRRQG